MQVTVREVLSWGLCDKYPPDKIIELFAGRKQLLALDILELNIPASDKLWVVFREGLIPTNTLHEFICRYTEYVLMRERKAGREPDARSWDAISTKRKWLRGETTDTKLSIAEGAAWEAAWDAEKNPAWSAARIAAWSAMAETAVWSVATGKNAWNAAWGVSENVTAWNEQVDILKELLINNKTASGMYA